MEIKFDEKDINQAMRDYAKSRGLVGYISHIEFTKGRATKEGEAGISAVMQFELNPPESPHVATPVAQLAVEPTEDPADVSDDEAPPAKTIFGQ